jgi:hypothetical protein
MSATVLNEMNHWARVRHPALHTSHFIETHALRSHDDQLAYHHFSGALMPSLIPEPSLKLVSYVVIPHTLKQT